VPSRRLTFDQQALISLEASPYRMLAIEKASEDEILAELLTAATQWPKRTKIELRRYGPGTPTLRVDLISIALGRTLRLGREAMSRDGADLYYFAERARLLRLTGERAGGIDEELVRAHEGLER
jgi:hypothetical protein